VFPPINILLIGHICRDETPDGPRLGGSVAFGALTFQALGLQPGIVTSAPDEMLPLLAPLAGIPVQRIVSHEATSFTNIYIAQGRRQVISGSASHLALKDIPRAWRAPPMVHLAPVADEIDPRLAGHFPGAFVGSTPQGWLRRWDKSGRVSLKRWAIPETAVRRMSALVFSIEDVQGDEALVRDIARQCPIVVATRGAEGSTLFVNGSPHDIPAIPVEEVDPTGAGDVFAAAFFTRLRASGDPVRAARFATFLAGRSVTRPGLDSIPTRQEISAAPDAP
jgi:sugar/nucleoside kinase (ribokinase family)